MKFKKDGSEFTEVIDAIYGTLTDNATWNDVVAHISDQFPYVKTVIHGFDNELDYTLDVVSSEYDPKMVSDYAAYYHMISPWVDDHTTRPLGDVYSTRDIEPNLECNFPEFFYDFAKPAGIGSGVATKFFDAPQRFGAISLDHSMKLPDTCEAELKNFLALIGPHIQRSIQLKHDLLRNGSFDQNFNELLQQSSHPVFVLSGKGKVEWSNKAAVDALQDGRGIVLNGDSILKFAKASDNRLLGNLIQQAANRGATLLDKNKGSMLFQVDRERGPNIATVSPLTGGVFGSDSGLNFLGTLGWRVLLVIRYRSDRLLVQAAELQAIFDLTKGEARVALALASGFSLREISVEFGVSYNTIRAHIKNIFIKTECRRQSELVLLVSSLTKSF